MRSMLAGYESSEQIEEISPCLYVNMRCMSMHKACLYYTKWSLSRILKKKLSGRVVPGRVFVAQSSGSLIKQKALTCLLTKNMDYMQKTCMAR